MQVRYKSNNRPGKFHKSVKVWTNADSKLLVLNIEGDVIPTPGKLRSRIGILGSMMNKIEFGEILFPQAGSDTLKVKNQTEDSVSVSMMNSPSYISVRIDPDTLAPSQTGKLIVTYSSKIRNDFGRSVDRVRLKMLKGRDDISGVFTVVAEVKEDFSLLTPQELIDAPVIYFPENRFKFGEVEVNHTKEKELFFENRGKRDLIIRNISTTNRLITIQQYDKIIKSGETGKIKLSANPIKPSNSLRSNISVISNDPKRSSISLITQGTVKFTAVEKKPQEDYDLFEKDAFNMIHQLKDSDKLVIIDVRTADEYEKDHLKRAVNLDLQKENFEQMIKILDKQKHYLIYSNQGVRSRKAVLLFREYNIKFAYNLKSGLKKWRAMKYKIDF